MLTSCASSPPVQFFTLDPLPADENAERATPVSSLQVARVRIPGSLDRQQIVRETAPNALQISDQYRWSAPLDQMIERTLSTDLRNRLPANSVLPPHSTVDSSTLRIVVNIDQFMLIPSGEVQLTGTWSLLSPNDKHSCLYDILLSAHPEGASYAAQVKVMSTLVARLANEIVEVIRRPDASSSCSQ
jgi:uncharacterized lipoprotein YmbA